MAGWFFTGMLLTLSDPVKKAIKLMNSEMLNDWFFGTAIHNPVVLFWFIIFCLIALILAISIVLCTYNNLLKSLVKKKTLRNWLLFGMHFNFIIILVFHVLTMLVGFKAGDIELRSGDKYEHKSGYSILISKVNFIDDLSVIEKKDKKSKREITLQNFSYKKNYAEIVLLKNGKIISEGKSYVMSPFKYKDIRLTIEKFIVTEKDGIKTAGINIIIVKNKLTEVFFIFYILEILLILAYTVISWKGKTK